MATDRELESRRLGAILGKVLAQVESVDRILRGLTPDNVHAVEEEALDRLREVRSFLGDVIYGRVDV